MTYLFIAHDLSVVRFISDRIAVIYKGVIVEVAETEELFNNPIHPYTQALLSAVPIPDPILERKKVLKVIRSKINMIMRQISHLWLKSVQVTMFWANQAELARYQQGLNYNGFIISMSTFMEIINLFVGLNLKNFERVFERNRILRKSLNYSEMK